MTWVSSICLHIFLVIVIILKFLHWSTLTYADLFLNPLVETSTLLLGLMITLEYAFVYMFLLKEDTYRSSKLFNTCVENELRIKIIKIRSDRGGEYCSRQFESYLAEHGIQHQKTVAYTVVQDILCELLVLIQYQ